MSLTPEHIASARIALARTMLADSDPRFKESFDALRRELFESDDVERQGISALLRPQAG